MDICMQVAIFTANSESLHPMLDEIADASGVAVSDDRYIIVRCQDVPGFEAVAIGAKVNTEKMQPGMVALAKEFIARHPRASSAVHPAFGNRLEHMKVGLHFGLKEAAV